MLLNYDCICEIVRHLSIRNWNNFRLSCQYTKDITDLIDISKLNSTVDIDIGTRKINGKTIPIHYVGEYTKSKYLTRIYRHGLGIYSIPTAQKSQNIFKGEFYYNRLKNHVVVYKRCRKPKDAMVNHYYEKDDIENRIEYSGSWLNGNPHGDGIMTKKINGQYFTERGNWIHGIKDGVFIKRRTFNKLSVQEELSPIVRILSYNTYKNNIKTGIQIVYTMQLVVTYGPYEWTNEYSLKIKEEDKTILEYRFQKKRCNCMFIEFYGYKKKIIHPLEFDHSRCKCSFCNQLLLFKSNNI